MPDIKFKGHFVVAFHVLPDISGCLTLKLAYCYHVRRSVIEALIILL